MSTRPRVFGFMVGVLLSILISAPSALLTAKDHTSLRSGSRDMKSTSTPESSLSEDGPQANSVVSGALVRNKDASPDNIEPAAVIMTEDFEGTWPKPGWDLNDYSNTDGGVYLLGKRSCRPRTGSYAGWTVGGGTNGQTLPCFGSYPHNLYTWAVYGPFDLSGAASASLRVYYWGETEYGGSSCPYDYLFLGHSVDNTNFYGYRLCGNFTSGPAGNGYYQANLDLGSRLGASQVWVGIVFVSDSSVTAQGITVDDILLDVVAATPPTPTRTPTPTSTPTPSCIDTPTPLPPFTGTLPATGEVDRRVSHCMDDAYVRVDTRQLVYDGRFVRMGSHPGGSPYMAGFLFRDVRIPRFARITSARLDLQPWGYQSGSPIDVLILGDRRPQPDDFNPNNLPPHERPLTGAVVPWRIEGNVTSGASSPDISSVISEIVSQTEWQPGNNLAILIQTDQSRHYIDWQAYEYLPTNAARLLVTYQVVATPTPTPTATATPTRAITPTRTRTPTPTRTRRAQGGFLPLLAVGRVTPTWTPTHTPTATRTPTPLPCPADPYEPNDTFAQAWGPLPLNTDFWGFFNCERDTDRDFYFFDLPSAGRVIIELTNIPANSDYDLTLYNCPNVSCLVVHSGQSGNAEERIDVNIPAGRYYVRVVRSDASPLVSQPYRLRVSYP